MATYVLPQVQVFQDFTIKPAAEANPLSACISGGHAYLVREAESAEREFGNLGFYTDYVDIATSWPTRPAGAVVDTSYTKLFIENALLRYYTKALSTVGGTINPVTGYASRIKSSAVNFATSGANARISTLNDRDVAIGDVISVSGVAGSTPITLWTYVRGLIAETVAATIGAATAATGNAATAASATATISSIGVSGTTTFTASGTSYNGLAAGKPTETYVVRVISSSVGGTLTTARLRVTSASGTDDQASVTPAASASPTSIGTRGLTVTFTSVSSSDLTIGQEYSVVVGQAFTATVPVSGGTYSSTDNATYIVAVTKGGAFGTAEISVTTANGVDYSGPTVVATVSTATPIGTKGVTMQLTASTTGLNKGDKFYVVVVGITNGAIRTLVLADNLNSAFVVGDNLGIDLYIRKPKLEVSANRTGMAPLVNWVQSATQITTKSGIVAYDTSWTSAGVALPLSVYSASALGYGKVYVQYRAWRATLVSQINSLTDVADIDAISGALTPDNPLKWGVFKALTNSNGTPVLYVAVSDPNNVDTWANALSVLSMRDDAYGLVPLTRNSTVLGLYQAHVRSVSSPTEGLWRTTWVNLKGIPEIPVVSAGSTVPNHLLATTTNGQMALATFSATTGSTSITTCVVPAGNAAFITNQVRAGDIVRALYAGDGFGGFLYTEYVVDAVESESQLRLKTGPAVAQTVAAKIEIWRNLSASEEAVELGQSAGSSGDRRVRATWPDLIESAGTVQEGYFLNCALAGLASGVLPQQGLTRLAIAGFSSTQRTNDKFNKGQLDVMAAAGVWVVQQSLVGEIFSRHAVTTGDYADINQREEMLVRNVDSISYRFKDYFEPYIGVTNVTPTMRAQIMLGLTSLIRLLQSERSTASLGGQLIAAEIASFEISAVFKDRYVASLTLTVPYALNTLELHLVV